MNLKDYYEQHDNDSADILYKLGEKEHLFLKMTKILIVFNWINIFAAVVMLSMFIINVGSMFPQLPVGSFELPIITAIIVIIPGMFIVSIFCFAYIVINKFLIRNKYYIAAFAFVILEIIFLIGLSSNLMAADMIYNRVVLLILAGTISLINIIRAIVAHQLFITKKHW